MKRNIRHIAARYNRHRAAVIRARNERAYQGPRRDSGRPAFRTIPTNPRKPQRTVLPRYVRDGERIQLVPGNVATFPGRTDGYIRRCPGRDGGALVHLRHPWRAA